MLYLYWQLARAHKWRAWAALLLDCVWNVMAHTQKPDFVFRRNGRVHLNRRGRQFNRLLATEVCVSAVVMLDTPCSKVVWRVQTTHSIHQFPLHFPSRASPCAITFKPNSTPGINDFVRLNFAFDDDATWRIGACEVFGQSSFSWCWHVQRTWLQAHVCLSSSFPALNVLLFFASIKNCLRPTVQQPA